MDFKKIFIKDACPTKIGGQAVIEGVMMKGSHCTAVSVRRAEDDIVVKVEPLKPPSKIMKIPVLRGIGAFINALITGTKTLMYSAEILEASTGETSTSKFDRWIEKTFGDKGITFILYLSVVIAVFFSVGFFIILPTVALHFMESFTDVPIILNATEGFVRILLFVLYIVLISRMEYI